MINRPRLSPRRVQLLLGVVLVGVFAFGLSARAEAGAVRDKPTVLAVWGLADGDTDAAGATVRVFAGRPADRGGAALAQTNGRRADRTHRSGVSLLAFRRLPSEFVVEVRGGRADGRRVPGTLRAAVRGYRSGDVVYVNPVTTMMAAYGAAVERGSLDRSGGARRLAYRELRIPHWMSHADLSYNDRRFDGDRFLGAARRAGGVGALVRRLLHDDRAGRRFRESRRLSAAQAPLGPVPEGILQGLAGVALRAMVTGAALGAGEIAQRNQIEVPGWLLAALRPRGRFRGAVRGDQAAAHGLERAGHQAAVGREPGRVQRARTSDGSDHRTDRPRQQPAGTAGQHAQRGSDQARVLADDRRLHRDQPARRARDPQPEPRHTHLVGRQPDQVGFQDARTAQALRAQELRRSQRHLRLLRRLSGAAGGALAGVLPRQAERLQPHQRRGQPRATQGQHRVAGRLAQAGRAGKHGDRHQEP